MVDAITVSALTKTFTGIRAVDGIDLTVQRGDVLGFLGPNGAGKTTTMRMITGFLEPTSGSVQVCGFDVQTHPVEAKARIGYLPEGAPAFAEMTPGAFLEFVAEVRGLSGARKDQRLKEVIAHVHLQGVLHQRIETLSKGFKRRVGLAQALLHDPEVLILDEPTDGLDPNQKHEVRELIARMAHDKAIVISTHLLEEVAAVCNRAVIIAQGKIVFSGTPAELAARSRVHNAVTLKVAADAAAGIEAALARIDTVQAVEQAGDEPGLLTVYSRNGKPIIQTISAAAHDHNWNILEMHVESGRLDEVFRDITLATDARGELSRT